MTIAAPDCLCLPSAVKTKAASLEALLLSTIQFIHPPLTCDTGAGPSLDRLTYAVSLLFKYQTINP